MLDYAPIDPGSRPRAKQGERTMKPQVQLSVMLLTTLLRLASTVVGEFQNQSAAEAMTVTIGNDSLPVTNNDVILPADTGCDSPWILQLKNKTFHGQGNRFHATAPLQPDYNYFPPALVSIVDSCIIEAWRKANMDNLTSRGYFRGAWKALENTHYSRLSREELLQPPLHEPLKRDSLVVDVKHFQITDFSLDAQNGIATAAFYINLVWTDERLATSHLKPPLNELARLMGYGENSRLMDSIWKPKVDETSLSHSRNALVKYVRVGILLAADTLVHAMLSFDLIQLDCSLQQLSRGDTAICGFVIPFTPVWSSTGYELLTFNAAEAGRNTFHVRHYLDEAFTHPPDWKIVRTSITAAKIRVWSDSVPCLKAEIRLVRTVRDEPPGPTTTMESRPLTATTPGDLDEDEDAPLTDTSSTAKLVFLDQPPAISAKEFPGSGVNGYGHYLWATSIIVIAAPLVGTNMKLAVAMKLLGVSLLQPVFLARLLNPNDASLPGSFLFLQYVILASIFIDVLAIRMLAQIRQRVLRVPPPNRIIAVSAAIVRRFAWMAVLAEANLPQAQLPGLPIVGRGGDGDVEGGGGAVPINNYANEWMVATAAGYIAWLGALTIAVIGALAAYAAG